MGGPRPTGRNSHGGGAGRGVFVERFASVAGERRTVECAAECESRAGGGGSLQISRDERGWAGARGSAAGVSVRAGIFEFSRDPGAAGGGAEIAASAGFIVLRWAGLRA